MLTLKLSKTRLLYINCKLVFVVELCRGELMNDNGIVRHWTDDNTDLFTGGDLLYCGGCCGQHIAVKHCNEHLNTAHNRGSIQVHGGQTDNAINTPVPGSGCDPWIDCFVHQCQVSSRITNPSPTHLFVGTVPAIP